MTERHKQLVRYLFVGGTVYAYELAFIWFGQRSGLSALWAVAGAFITGTLLSFFLQKLVTFGDKRMHRRIVGLQLLATILLVCFNLGFTLLCTALLQHLLPATIIRTLALGITTIWNFYLYKTHIFNPQPIKSVAKTSARPLLESPHKRSVGYLAGTLIVFLCVLLVGSMGNWSPEARRHDNPRPLSPNVRARLDKASADLQKNLLLDEKCQAKTSLQIVAHQDDDLLFMNPDVAKDIQAGACVATVYLTAGDLGRGIDYVLGREAGIKVAYAQMAGVPSAVWQDIEATVDGHPVHLSHMEGNQKIWLIFLRMHDGNINGHGFRDHTSSLFQVERDGGSIGSVVGDTAYTRRQLIEALTGILSVTRPQTVRTHESRSAEATGDHSDHIATGRLAKQATRLYVRYTTVPTNAQIKHYMGYAIRSKPVNLDATDIEAKRAIFLTYAPYDDAMCPGGVCSGGTDGYEDYLARQYSRTDFIR